ncbi:protein MANBAL isoform X1 [Panthera tigris]|uniref:protein MANBAL isoform X1 n=1 Tax=Panthera tigris TaxID=9694 RepID=UPI001C6FAB7B|nr:protein MANBAL isoform X1 [Panthera tigris]
MASDLDFSPPEVPEPTFLENLLRYGLFLGAIFQLICVLAIIVPVPKSHEVGTSARPHRTQCGGCPPAGRHSPPLPALAVCGLNGRRRTAGPEGEQATAGLSHSRLPTCHLPGTSTGPAASRRRGAFHAFCLLTSALRGVHHCFHLRGGRTLCA